MYQWPDPPIPLLLAVKANLGGFDGTAARGKHVQEGGLLFFFITLGLELSDTKVCEP